MTKLFKVSVVMLMILLCFGACSSSKPPEEPITTGKQSYTYKNELGQTAPVAENIKDYPGITQPVKHVATTHEIECVFNSWYTYGKTYATIESIKFENVETPQGQVYADVSAKLISKGNDKQMKIAFKAYDKDGNVLKANGCLTRDIVNIAEDEAFSFTFTVPHGTAKVEFFDYIENK